MSELPKGWVKAKISDVTVKCTQSKPADESPITYIDIGSINRQTKKIEEPQYIIGKDAPSRARKIVNTNDVLVSLTRPNLNAVALVDEKFNEQYASTGFEVLKPIGIDSRYLFALVKSNNFINSISGAVKGALYPAAKSSDVQEFEFPLAPLNEQKRIADKLDSILAKVDRAQARLDKIPGILKRFRQSVLAAATSGELTREWRGGGDHNWPNVALGTVGKAFNYGSSAKSQAEGDVPVLRMGNLQGGKLDWDDLVYTSDKVEIEKYLLEDGDVLFNRTNSPELVGKTSIYRGERKAIYAGYLIRIKGSDRLNTEFLNIQLNSPHARDYCWQVKTDGVSQSNINAKKLQAYEFDLPEMEEQLEIVRRVGELFSHAMLFERQYIESKRRFDRLSQSVLAKAFRGELADQNPSDEPADILLERIKQQQREAPKSTRQTRKPAAKVIPSVDVVETDVELTPPESEILALLKNTSGELSAQQIMELLTEKTFEQVDALFSELKRLLDNNSIVKVGSGEACTFKAIKR